VFGPNALGGTLAIRTLSGREASGASAMLGTGSFGRRNAELTLGGTHGELDGFVGASSYEDDGWRDRSPTRVRQFHAKAGWERDATRVALAYTRGDNRMNGNGLVPEALLDARREAVYTYPDTTRPQLDFWQLAARHSPTANSTLSAHAYWRRLRIGTVNGDAEFDDAGTPFDGGDDAYEAEFRSTRTRQDTTGAALQFAWRGEALGLGHRLALGLTRDAGRARFAQFEQDGAFTADRGVVPDGTPALDTDVYARTRYTGAYASDLVSLGEAATLTLAARHDAARVSIADRSGVEPDLDGRHRFARTNPSLGLAWSRSPALALTLAYSEGFRMPTPVELTCASPDDPCALPVAFVADPPLDPVVARSWEAGARGAFAATLQWRATTYRTRLTNDILFTSVGAGRGYFANFPATRRQGLELELRGGSPRLSWHASWSLVDATYRSDLALFNPVANAADPSQPAAIDVRRGDRLPATPRQLAKLGVELRPVPALELGVALRHASAQFLRGDDANAARPLAGYTVVDVRFRYELTPRFAVRGGVDNALDERYASIGAFNRVAFDAGGEPLEGVGPGPVQRFVSPGAPRSWWLAVEYRTGGVD
jgi:outer membrane receptor protein involved in Fe transport